MAGRRGSRRAGPRAARAAGVLAFAPGDRDIRALLRCKRPAAPLVGARGLFGMIAPHRDAWRIGEKRPLVYCSEMGFLDLGGGRRPVERLMRLGRGGLTEDVRRGCVTTPGATTREIERS